MIKTLANGTQVLESRLSLHGIASAYKARKVMCRAYFDQGYFQEAEAQIFYKGQKFNYDRDLKLIRGPADFDGDGFPDTTNNLDRGILQRF